MLIKVGKREDAIHALINIWLKDTTKRCGWCGTYWFPGMDACCEQPFIGSNAEIFERFYHELKLDRDSRKNDHASMINKTMRWALKMPPGLLEFLQKTFRDKYGEELFNDKYPVAWFAKKFRKYFAIPKIV